ncbi:MAG TPA: arylamine N-acetyltransferase [Pseudonocardiaceae bacterium]|nr:arylamine N-acetyltransferase [Pseudonocardiaceae bacterium]
MSDYLDRISANRLTGLNLDTLRELHQQHVRTVPFENLSIHLGEPIVLDEDALVDKIVRRRRGGFCYELNGAFAALLTALGFQVSLLSAAVIGADGRVGPPFDHLALRVELDQPWLADVGFGRHSRFPLAMGEQMLGVDQPDPGGVFRLEPTPDGDLDVLLNGRVRYRVELRPRSLADFGPTCWYQQTSPLSHFTRSLACTLPIEDGQITLSGQRLVRTEGDERVERELTEADTLTVYQEIFGIPLDRLPEVEKITSREAGGDD